MEILATILMSAFGILALLFIGIMIIISLFLSIHTEKQYKINVIEILKDKKSDSPEEKIKNAYNIYINRRYGFGYLNIIVMNQKLEEELRTGEYRKYYSKSISDSLAIANKLDEVVIALKEQIRFDDEKANQLFDKLTLCLPVEKADIIQDIKLYLVQLVFFNKGQLFEKDYRISNLEEKVKRKHWVTWIFGGIGFVGSILTIFTAFKLI